MWTVFNIELFKIFKRPRTYIAFSAIGIIVMLIQLALFVDGQTYVDFMLQSMGDSFQVQGNIMNGYMICYIILQTIFIHVPLLIAVIGGDMIAGEASMGTLRVLLTKPVSRSSILIGKFWATIAYTWLLLCWMAFLSLGISTLIFGTGDMIIFKSEQIVALREADLLWRYFAAFGFAALALAMVATLSFFLSIFAENSIGPISSTMSIVIVFTILSTIDIPFFRTIQPFLFTSHMLAWKAFFDDPIDYSAIWNSVLNLSVHLIVFLLIISYLFKRKDILT
jgi:ABC-2 type transport system permease protein